MVEVEKKEHPLSRKVITPIQLWSEWKALWEARATPGELLGLLHCGFETTGNPEDLVDRFCFYLDMADGYRSGWNDHVLPENGPQKALAQKAWKVLCVQVFAPYPERGICSLNRYHDYLQDERGLRHLLSFFLRGYNIPRKFDSPNRDKYYSDVALTFLTQFIQHIWHVGSLRESEDIRTPFFRRVRPDLVWILLKTFKEDFLLRETIDIDDTTLATIEGIARNRSTVEETLVRDGPYCAGRAAKVFLLLEAIRKGKESLSAAQ